MPRRKQLDKRTKFITMVRGREGLLSVIAVTLVFTVIGSSYMLYSSALAYYPSIASCKSSQKYIGRGNNSDCVKTIQASLNATVYGGFDYGIQIDRSSYCNNIVKLKTDGDFGAKTENFVRCFQDSRGLSHDGVVGPDTFKYLHAKCSSTSKVTAQFAAARVKCGARWY